MTEPREATIKRLEDLGSLVPDCPQCVERYSAGNPLSVAGPSHTPSRRCKSGRRPHCTCDTCF